MNQSAIRFFVSVYSGATIPTSGQFVSGESGHQSADNASREKPSNVYDWVYFVSHEAVKIVLCGGIGGIIGSFLGRRLIVL